PGPYRQPVPAWCPLQPVQAGRGLSVGGIFQGWIPSRTAENGVETMAMANEFSFVGSARAAHGRSDKGRCAQRVPIRQHGKNLAPRVAAPLGWQNGAPMDRAQAAVAGLSFARRAPRARRRWLRRAQAHGSTSRYRGTDWFRVD